MIGNPTIRLEGYVGGYGAGIEAGSRLTGGSYLAMGKAVWDGEGSWNTTTGTQDSYFTIHTTENGTLAEKFRIASTGNVGIGTTSPSYKLDVNGTMQVNSIFRFASNGQFNWGGGYSCGTLTWDSGYAMVQAQGTNTLKLYSANASAGIDVTSTGSVGIGTSSPGTYGGTASKLDVNGALHAYSAYFNEMMVSPGYIVGFSGPNSYLTYLYSPSGAELVANINGTEKFRIGSTGIVGIGTTTTPTSLSGAAICLADAGAVPTANPASGGALYSEGGALKWRSAGGTTTTIAPN